MHRLRGFALYFIITLLLLLGLSGALRAEWTSAAPLTGQNRAVPVSTQPFDRAALLGEAAEDGRASCSTPLQARVSTDSTVFQTNITLSNLSRRYYFSAGAGCSAKLAVKLKFCDLAGQNCAESVTESWRDSILGTYKTNDDGIARISIPETISSGIYVAQFRPAGTDEAWSEPITNTVTLTPSRGTAVDLANYLQYEPGDVYLFHTENNVTNSPFKEGRTRLQIEAERIWQKAGCPNQFRIRPWRFTKENDGAYWNPDLNGAYAANVGFRWFVIAPDDVGAAIPNFNQYYWGVGHKVYAAAGLQDLGPLKSTIEYGITAGNVPAYNLGRKGNIDLPFVEYNDRSFIAAVDAAGCPNPYVHAGMTPNYHWLTRSEKEGKPLSIGSQVYSDVVRIDFFESNQTNGHTLRESWYFQKGIGLVQILGKHFNLKIPSKNIDFPPCDDDSDCQNDTIITPHIRVTLQKHYRNPTFVAQASNDNSNFSTEICTAPSSTYHFQLMNSDYSGYLEAERSDGALARWYWVENGYVAVNLVSLPLGVYTARFRIWAPDTLDESESSVVKPNLAWSNPVTIRVQSRCDLVRSLYLPQMMKPK